MMIRLAAGHKFDYMKTTQPWHAHSIPPFPVLVGVIALQYALGDVSTFFDHELVEWIRQVTC